MHAAEFDEASGDFVLLIEDLSSLRCADQVVGCSVADAETVLEHIADHHVHFAAPRALDAVPWVPGIDDPVMHAVVGGMAKQALPGFFEIFGADLDTDLVRFFETMPEMLPHFMQSSAEGEGTTTLAHVDLRLDNVFFGDPERPMVLIDWQLSSQGPFAYDVAYFLSQSMDTECVAPTNPTSWSATSTASQRAGWSSIATGSIWTTAAPSRSVRSTP